MNGALLYIAGVGWGSAYMVITIAVMIMCILASKRSFFRGELLCSLCLFLLAVYMCLLKRIDTAASVKDMFSLLLRYVSILLFMLLPWNVQKHALVVFSSIFAISLVPSLLYWVLSQLGIQLPFTELESKAASKTAAGVYYEMYPGALITKSRQGFLYYRLCGVYDEPGVVGTIGALLLAADGYRFKKSWRNGVLLLAGVLTASLAFYAICSIYFICWAIKKNAVKAVGLMFSLLVLFMIFMSVDFTNPNLLHFQHRLRVVDGKVQGDNRTTGGFDESYEEFWEDDMLIQLFGNGAGAANSNENMAGGASYKIVIYDYGIVGLAAILAWIILTVLYLYGGAQCWRTAALSLVFLASIYQRPDVFNMSYMIVLLGGSAGFAIEKQYPQKRITYAG